MATDPSPDRPRRGKLTPGLKAYTYSRCRLRSMTDRTASQARANLYRLVEEAAASHKPIRIVGKRHSGILISEEDWAAIQETLHLLSIPGMRESIRKGMETPTGKLARKLVW